MHMRCIGIASHTHLADNGGGDACLCVKLDNGGGLLDIDLHDQAQLLGKEGGEGAVGVLLGGGQVGVDATVACTGTEGKAADQAALAGSQIQLIN